MSKKNLGWVYILTNPAFKEGMIKIGFTSRDTPQQRANELSSATGVPTKFVVVWAARMPNAQSVETQVHRVLQNKRSNNNREFFECHIHEAIDTIETVAGTTIITKIDNRIKINHKSEQQSNKKMRQPKNTPHKHRGLIGTIMILLLLFLGTMFVVGLNVEKKEAQSQSNQPPQSSTALPENHTTNHHTDGASNQDVQTAWLKITPEIRETLHEEQQEWQRQKKARCAKVSNQSACERELNQARIMYLNGFSI